MLKPRQISTFRNEVESLLKGLKTEISNEYRLDEEDTVPGIQVTIGATIDETGVSWNYQTGDNSYTGGAYGHPHWAVLYLYRRSNCRNLAKEAVTEILDLIHTL